MSPSDEERSSILPTLSWDSIVADRPSDASADETEASAAPTDTPADSGAATVAAPGVGAATAVPQISMSLRLDEFAVPPAPPMPPVSFAAPAPTAVPPAPPMPSTVLAATPPLGDVAPIAVPPPPVSSALLPEPVADLDDAPPDLSAFKLTMSPLSIPDDEPSSSYVPIQPVGDFVLPTIREATPVQPYEPDAGVDAADGSAGSEPLGDVGTADVAGAFVTTNVPAVSGDVAAVPSLGAIVLPRVGQPDQSASTVVPMSPLAVEMPQQRKAVKRRRRTGLRLIIVLVLLVGIVAGAIVFGRPYLFPDDWTAEAKPYATAVQDVTNTEFAEPVLVTAEPASTYQARATAQLAGDWESQVPTWRALGLASGDVTEAGLDELLAGWSPALYSTDDGQIYHDDSVDGPALDALITQAMAAAQLDQAFGWAIGQPGRTLDDAALTSANVLAQATAIQSASAYATPIESAPTAPLAYLPAVVSYQVLAPSMYAPLLAPVDPAGTNPLAELAVAAPGPLAPDQPVVASAPVVQDGDVIVASPVAMDRSFWYLMFASYLDAPTSFAASEAVVESALTVAERAGTTCAYVTFSGGDLVQTSTVRSALEQWVATVPAEFTSAFSVTDDGNLQLVSCDPGSQFVGANRVGTARELIGWRSAEIGTINGVIAAGGGEADIAAALIRLVQSDVGAQLATAPVGDTPAEAAQAVTAAVAPIVSPPPPVVEPEG